MKFCDKLANLRKSNDFSQEQFADKLGVSRQAVSKWESGSSYPDMEKIIQMCSILNCTLEDLLDDGVIKGTTSEKEKFNLNNYLQDGLNFITKTYNMFSSMNFKQKIKCIFELASLVFILFILGAIIFSIVNIITYNIVDLIPFNIKFFIEKLLESVYVIILLMIAIIIFIHIFKIRYLDYFITIEDKTINHKIIEEDKINKEAKREKIIIRDPKHSSFSFFHLLAKMTLYFVKLLVVMFLIPTILFFVFLIIMLVISLCHINYGLIFLFIAIALLGSSILSLLVIYFLYNFIFNRKEPLKLIFIIFVISLILIGIGIGLSSFTLMNYKYYNINDISEVNKKTEYINIKDNTELYIMSDNISYVIDDSLENVKLEITYPKDINYEIDYNEELEIYHLYLEGNSLMEAYHFILENLKEKRVLSLDDSNILKVVVYLSEKNYELLNNNSNGDDN